MQIDFSKQQDKSGAEPVKPVETPAANTAPVPAIRQDLPLGAKQSALSEVCLPRLNLVHSVGLLKDSHPVGAFVHNQSLTLYLPPAINVKTSTVERAGSPPLVVTFLDLRPTRYFEHVAGGGKGLICDTLDQVAAAGGSTNYREFKAKEKDGMKRYDFAVDCLLAVERPEMVADDGTVFVFDVDGKQYALCLYNMKGSAFTVLKKTVLTDQHIGCLRKGTATHSYALSSRLEPTPDRSSTYWRPVLVPHKPSTPAFLEFAKSVLSAPVIETPDAE